MFTKSSRINPRDLRKQLLIAESEINRVQLIDESRVMAGDFRTISARVKSMCSLSSVATLVSSGMNVFQGAKTALSAVTPSWFQTALKGAQIAANLWMAYRARPR